MKRLHLAASGVAAICTLFMMRCSGPSFGGEPAPDSGIDGGHDGGLFDGGIDAGVDAGADAGPVCSDDAGAWPSANIVFVSSLSRAPFQLGSVFAADQLCQAMAGDAGLSNPASYRAWLSDSVSGAKDHVADGGARGWIRTDGLPVTDTLDSLTRELILWHPIVLDEHGAYVDATVMTGTNIDGGLASNCANWSTDAGWVILGQTTAGNDEFTYESAGTCRQSYRWYCFGTARNQPIDILPRCTGRLAFLSRNKLTPGAPFTGQSGGGLPGVDALCQSEASSAGLSGTFIGLIAWDGGSPASRFEPDASTWYRADGVALMPSASALFDAGTWLTTLNVDATGAPAPGRIDIWTGSYVVTWGADGGLGATCGYWTGGGGIGLSGRADLLNYPFGGAGSLSVSCISSLPIYCFQR